MRIGIFGGTFNPPHVGHINSCKIFLEKLQLDKLFVIPVFSPPHKSLNSMASPKSRMEMCRLAFAGISNKIEISDVEISRKGKSYTADTIAHFKSLGYNDVYFLCGTDMLLTLDSWYRPDYIFENATIVYARRENDEDKTVLIEKKVKAYKEKFSARIVLLELDSIEMSSSIVRERISNNESINCYVTSEVAEFIKKNGLYKEE